MLKKLLFIAASAVGGIYLTSDEGKNVRKALLEKKSTFKPIIDDLLKQANEVLEGTKDLESEELKLNLDKLVNEAKVSLIELDLDKTMETIKDAIKVASKQIRKASAETEKEMLKSVGKAK